MSEISNCSAKDSAFLKMAPRIMPEMPVTNAVMKAQQKRAAEKNHSNAKRGV
jgi:hypothetical protein